MRTPKIIQILALPAVAAAWFALVIPWNGFSDPDAFYHAKMALLILQSGPVRAFPWLDLTLLGQHFADLHFAFHVFLVPFVAAFGALNGLRVATILLSTIFVTVFAACLRRLNIRWSFVWSVLLLVSQGFVFRLLLGKATPLALIWYFFGLTAAWKRRPWFVALAAFGYALSHGGWIYLAGSVVLLAFGDALYSFLVEDQPWRQAIKKTLWIESLAAFGGAFMGLVVHPNFSQIFVFSWTQIVTIGLGTPFQHVLLGQEWLPADLSGFISSFAPWIILCLLGLVGLLFAPKKPLDTDRARFLTSFGWILAVFVALTLKSRRNVEFLVPVTVLWCATLWSMVDVEKLRTEFQSKKKIILVAPWVALICLVALFGKQAWVLWSDLHPPVYQDDVYAKTMAEISKRATPGDRVFHSSWDEFPMLFLRDDRLRYMAGLDPTFLYVASSTLSDAYRDVTWGVTTATRDQAWSLIHDRVNAQFVFVSKKNHGKLLDLIRSDTRFVQIADEQDSVAFEITEGGL